MIFRTLLSFWRSEPDEILSWENWPIWILMNYIRRNFIGAGFSHKVTLKNLKMGFKFFKKIGINKIDESIIIMRKYYRQFLKVKMFMIPVMRISSLEVSSLLTMKNISKLVSLVALMHWNRVFSMYERKYYPNSVFEK